MFFDSSRQGWVDCYEDSLNDEEKHQVAHKKSDTVFKFGGSGRLTPLGKVVLQCYLAAQNDLANDKAKIYGQVVDLQNRSAGHYCVPLKETSVQIKNCFTVVEADEDNVRVITKLHKQFAHPSANRQKGLLRDDDVLNPA